MPWAYLDPDTAALTLIPNTDSRATKDFTWMGIRKGGRRWHRTFTSDGAFFLEAHQADTVGFDYRVVLQADPSKTQPRIEGLTNDKKHIYSSWRSNNGTNNDWLQVNDLDGNFLQSFTWSDGVTNHNRQLVFKGHHLFVISTEGALAYALKKYDMNGQLIFKNTLPVIAGISVRYLGITTDGRDFYLIWEGTIASPTIVWAVLKVNGDAPHRQKRFYGIPAGLLYDEGITFNGRFLIVQLQLIPP